MGRTVRKDRRLLIEHILSICFLHYISTSSTCNTNLMHKHLRFPYTSIHLKDKEKFMFKKSTTAFAAAIIFSLSGCASITNDAFVPMSLSFSDGSSGTCKILFGYTKKITCFCKCKIFSNLKSISNCRFIT